MSDEMFHYLIILAAGAVKYQPENLRNSCFSSTLLVNYLSGWVCEADNEIKKEDNRYNYLFCAANSSR